MRWLPIRYRDFYDVPRAFVVEHAGEVYLFDSPFDDRADEYPDHYKVYRLELESSASLDIASWTDLAKGSRFLGVIPIARVTFDPTRRASIDGAVFGLL